MSRSIFGWDLPPGVTVRQIEEAAGAYDRCEVCGRDCDDCICPKCKDCGLPTPTQDLYEGRCSPCQMAWNMKLEELGH